MKVTKEVKDSVAKVVKDLVSSNPKGGEMNLDDICAKIPSANRWEVVNALRHSSDGIFVTGRRGLKSRFMFGEPAKPMAQSIRYRQDYRQRNTRRSPSTPQSRGNDKSEASLSQTMSLRIGIGDKSTTIPITIEMVPS